MDKKELSSLIREEIKSVLKEGDFELSQGYGSAYYKTASDILETWTSMKTVEDDLMKFMEAAAQTQGAGPKFATAIAGLLAKVASKGMAKYKNAGPVYEAMAYGEKEAADEINSNPKIEDTLKKIRGYESIVSGNPGTVYVYFKQEQSAKAGAKILDKMVPGPDYENSIVQDSGSWVIEVEPDNVNESKTSKKKSLKENADLGFKPTKKQQEIMDLIHEMTEHKKTGLIKYMFSVIGDDLNMAYYHWSDDTWKKAEKFFEAYEEAMKKQEVKEADMKMKEYKPKKK